MIAIIILGVGLLVVATMFPIAWSKARDLTENTTANTCTDNALANVQLVTRVSQPESDPTTLAIATISSFFGDATDDGAGGELPADPWVHALHMQNWIIGAPVTPGPSPPPPLWGDFADPTGSGAITGVNADFYLNLSAGLVGNPGLRPPYQIAFQDRVSPPLPNPAGLTGPALARWRELLRQRRFCWAVLHKLNYDWIGVPSQAPSATDQRTFTMYYVTLRRGQSTHRFARQQAATAPPYRVPGTLAGGYHTPAPNALAPAEDAMLPIPWRVQIELAPPPTPPSPPTGLPTEAYANLGGATNRLVTEMVPPGAWLIDELNGLIYRVTKRDIDPANPDQAILTLDHEVPRYLLDDDGSSDPSVPENRWPDNQPPELIRTVWVFPPAVEKARSTSDNLPLFIGPQPVVDIQCHVVTYWP